MPDISMCANETCPSKSLCYRHQAKPNEWRQAYAMFRPDDSGRCDDFAPMAQRSSDDDAAGSPARTVDGQMNQKESHD